MKTLLALLATALACALARPSAITNGPPNAPLEQQRTPGASGFAGRYRAIPLPVFIHDYIMPRYMLPNYLRYSEPLPAPRVPLNDNILDREIDFIRQMELQGNERNQPRYPRWQPDESPTRHLGRLPGPTVAETMHPVRKSDDFMIPPLKCMKNKLMKKPVAYEVSSKHILGNKNNTSHPVVEIEEVENAFALTPLQSGYYKNVEQMVTPKGEQPDYDRVDAVINERKTRQNPNLSKTKTLVAEHLDMLRTGFTQEDAEGTSKPYNIHILESPTADPTESIYSITLIAAIGAALMVAVIGLTAGWYILSKKAKDAADVDYPAYGVTGPNVDTSGDRKLAQSAHLYHYQHQKQQIIAMERSGMDRSGSMSDPESEDENEEGDYTVYECPGFATTGDMEVKNPLFKGDGTPANAAKNEGEKAQPNE